MTLYLDSLFIINFMMNYIILFLTGKIANHRFSIVIKLRKYLIGSLTTTLLYLCIIGISALRNNFNFLFAVIIIAIGVIVTFRPKKIKTFLTYLLFTHVVAFSVGGISFGLFYYTKAGAFIGNTVEATTNNLSFKLLLAATSFAYVVIKITVAYVEKTKLSRQIILNTKIEIEGPLEVPMLVDTGNTLVDPLSKLPVVIVYYKTLDKILNPSLFRLYENNEDVMSTAFDISDELSCKLKIIPFKSVGCASGIILGIESTLEFTFEDECYRKKCVVGIVDFEIAKNKEYCGIFNPMLIKEEVVNVKKVAT